MVNLIMLLPPGAIADIPEFQDYLQAGRKRINVVAKANGCADFGRFLRSLFRREKRPSGVRSGRDRRDSDDDGKMEKMVVAVKSESKNLGEERKTKGVLRSASQKSMDSYLTVEAPATPRKQVTIMDERERRLSVIVQSTDDVSPNPGSIERSLDTQDGGLERMNADGRHVRLDNFALPVPTLMSTDFEASEIDESHRIRDLVSAAEDEERAEQSWPESMAAAAAAATHEHDGASSVAGSYDEEKPMM
jgi:hypothetical protein